jgi:hypothetical protein
MNNVRFALVIGALVVITLGVIGLRYNVEASPVIHPVVVVYRDKTIRQGQSLPPGDRVWTLAVRSDGSLMQAEGMPDATEHISTAKSIEFKDRYVVIDPHTMSTSTYKPYKPIVVPTRDCLGSRAGSILGHPVEYVHENQNPKSKGNSKITRERWLAVDLNCVILREHLTDNPTDGRRIDLYREAASAKVGEPPADFFDIPSNYQERGPAELNKEFETRFPGRKVFPKQEAEDKLQKVYDADKLR